MKILDLTNLEKSEVKYKTLKYPDGQQDIVIDGKTFDFYIEISSRFNSFMDLELIICTAKSLRRLGVKEVSLYIPYLLGSRSDRQFQKGGTSYLVDVVAPIINSLKFNKVNVLDVHSDIAAACINNLSVVDNVEFVKSCLSSMYDCDSNKGDNVSVLVSPDAGALKKIYNLTKSIEYKGEIIVANKHRNLNGEITHTTVPFYMEYSGKDFIIIDDICDGGRTFIEIAKKIKEKFPSSKIYLIVTHGIFSAGLKELIVYFNHIYTTNSIMNFDEDTEFWSRNDKYLNKVTQVNIF
jgi:ribose-phosphate pyrophosphokinase